ncbi:MAG: glucose-1-phosphate thymidylyltransferase [Candidatus Hadarchaeales archaeon]
MKALVLSGGKGTRLRPLTFTLAKQLIPVANKPVLGYVLDQVAKTGIKEVGVVIAPETGEYVKKYVGDGSQWGINVTYILQEPLGLAHAVTVAKDFLGDDDFVMCLGDNLLESDITDFINTFKRENLDALIFVKEVEDPTKYGVVIFDEKGNIVKLIEKPKVPPTNLALVGLYIFSNKIHHAIKRIRPSWRGELEITDTIQEMINLGFRVKATHLQGWWLDTGKKDDVLTANAKILDKYGERDIKGEIKNCKIEGRVKISPGSVLTDCTVRGPVLIGKDCRIENSFIGPYTSIGDGARIINSSIEYCVILENAQIQDVRGLEESLIGRNAKVTKTQRGNVRLHVGDYSEVEI